MSDEPKQTLPDEPEPAATEHENAPAAEFPGSAQTSPPEIPLVAQGVSNTGTDKADIDANSEPETPEPEPVASSQTAGETDEEIATSQAAQEAADAAVLAQSRAYTRRSFVVAGAAVAAGIGINRWLANEPMDERQPGLLRRAFETNASLSRALGREEVLAPTYPIARAETIRVNGIYGLKRELLAESYRLQVVGSRSAHQSQDFSSDVTAWEYSYATSTSNEDQGHDTKVAPRPSESKSAIPMMSSSKMATADMMQKAEDDENHTGRRPRGMEESGESRSTLRPGTPGLLLTMEKVLQLPRHEFVTQFKCIEGWSQYVQWAGIRLRDFIEAYPPALIGGKEPAYVYMETPDGDYYTGYDLKSCRHPQALLVTEMMGAPLTQFHGAPLRLHMPNKYGYKQIKRIALISYTNDKPDDYWTKLGYDWYGGL